MQAANDNFEDRKRSIVNAMHERLPYLMMTVMQGKLASYTGDLDKKSKELEYTAESLGTRLLEYEALARSGANVQQLHANATDIFGGDRAIGAQWMVVHAVRARTEGLMQQLVAAEISKEIIEPGDVVGPHQRAHLGEVRKAQQHLVNAMVSFGGVGENQAKEQVRDVTTQAREMIRKELGFGQEIG